MSGGIRKPWVGGNWKCNGTLKSIEELCEKFSKAECSKTQLDVVICPSTTHLSLVKRLLPADKFEVASQNISKTGNGAFTGETSCEMLADMGIKWSLVGHSERRQYYGETDAVVTDKVDYCLNKAVAPADKINLAVCIGELLAEREANQTVEVCTRQMKAFIPKVTDWSRIVVAYEPVWAIGTGKVATPEQAQEAHEAIRKLVAKEVSQEVADALRIVYGGSVTDQNCLSLICMPDIDGFLVGGASLKPGFLDIISSSATAAV
eukprot:GHVQ01041484.1.p1 GENE.GHVQ01041484.1~~GHVQ01041484.1.p1  ORF type:complete len:263 (+),score=39.43 GHVQ01041484.1:264-1052(+)